VKGERKIIMPGKGQKNGLRSEGVSEHQERNTERIDQGRRAVNRTPKFFHDTVEAGGVNGRNQQWKGVRLVTERDAQDVSLSRITENQIRISVTAAQTTLGGRN